MKGSTMNTKSNKVAAVVITVAKDGNVTDVRFNDTAAIRKFRPIATGRSWEPTDSGERFCLGLAYVLGNKADREALITWYGKGVVRFALLKTVHGAKDEKTAAMVTALAEGLRSLKVKVAA